MKDLFGNALRDYHNNNYTEDLVTSTNISDKDDLPLPYLFRSFVEMPKLEQKALQLAKGQVLDVGCGAGSHSLYLQQKGLKVKAIDYSKGAVEVAKARGVLTVELKALLDETETFDTILLLMNGTGIFQELKQLSTYLKHLKSLLKPNGQILIDSSDIQYMYEDDDGGLWIDTNAEYYGELDYFLSYKGEEELPMKWLYLDFERLNLACESVGLTCEKSTEGEHFDYLARLT
ncbi:class I SAM-dependent methyltransferase [Subsaximicrobium wynnwilliamsii]|uniref:Class I SAM-dependent methyltransferase n=1 Tax=Subsaximicrobium wynnwilliamsii TaxID=291179 RepID=A0A5C6ZCK4_9FLAO|nr:class I SAM-dependent methyltransferase [Subsaximicrobium wynnwilliamsii]TXD81085.1 class I SAM-dependent methyltransferase [Subsaximicrobium wynnwilliamsii]TXD86759.1 class I SAM-dependent methyltransferase [Subsaximicrobium wynnwilliamsii]TXE00388.1 class I SAM-dependent methyltransferase [Subsaximicrobium wynnwilliamsii]